MELIATYERNQMLASVATRALLKAVREAAVSLKKDYNYSLRRLSDITGLHKNSCVRIKDVKWRPTENTLTCLQRIVTEHARLVEGAVPHYTPRPRTLERHRVTRSVREGSQAMATKSKSTQKGGKATAARATSARAPTAGRAAPAKTATPKSAAPKTAKPASAAPDRPGQSHPRATAAATGGTPPPDEAA